MTVRYLVMVMKESGVVTIGEQEYEVPMTWAPGMVGVLPVFEDPEAAKIYAPEADIVALDDAGSPEECDHGCHGENEPCPL